MKANFRSSPQRWHFGLRYKVALLFALPVLLIAVLIWIDHFTGEKKAIEEQASLNSVQMGAILLSSMKHSMIMNDHSMMDSILNSISQQGEINRIWIVDMNGVIQASSVASEVHTQADTQSIGCIECHIYPADSRPLSQNIKSSPSTVRVVTPIRNDPECRACHPGSEKHLGVLLIDNSTLAIENQLLTRLRWNLLLMLGVIIIGMLVALVLANTLVIRRIEVMQRAMQAFKNGDYSVRITQNWRTADEFTQLAETFNNMVAAIAHHEEEKDKIAHVRWQAIMDERERIARELHDGVAQFLGYVSTKIMAIRTLLEKNETEAAQKHLAQISQVVQDQSVDVRASIIGLKLAERTGDELAASLLEYVRQCNLLIDLPIELEIEPPVENIKLHPEVELQFIRIVQEATSNIRKHAQAHTAKIRLAIVADKLVLSIRDDGIGFNPWEWNQDRRPHFGLQTMRERADLAGIAFSIVSEPGHGTTVTLQLPLERT